MKRTHVDSSSISSVGYDETAHLLEVKFNNGRTYDYENVPREVYDAFMAADSHGRFFNHVIRNGFPTRQVH